MMRSMYSGVAGLKTHQTRMDVIGNNIANVNTVGYKAQAAQFAELLYQNSSAASGPNEETRIGGVNPKQVGLGVKMASISTNITLAGSAETTNNPFDILITGDSFFVVNNGRDNMFTRDGSFKVDAAGNLVMSSTGYRVMGWQPDPDTGAIKKDTVSALIILSAANMTYPPEATTQAYVSGIVDAESPEVNSEDGKIMNLNFFDDRGYSYTAKMAIKKLPDDPTSAFNSYTCELVDLLDSLAESVMDQANAVFGSRYIEGESQKPFNKDNYNLEYDTANTSYTITNGNPSSTGIGKIEYKIAANGDLTVVPYDTASPPVAITDTTIISSLSGDTAWKDIAKAFGYNDVDEFKNAVVSVTDTGTGETTRYSVNANGLTAVLNAAGGNTAAGLTAIKDDGIDFDGKFINGLTIQFRKSNGEFAGLNDDTSAKTADLAFNKTSPNASNFKDITVDFSTLSNVANEKVSTAAATNGSLANKGGGRKLGKMSGVSIGREGKIYATYDNGQSKLLGQIAAASFANPSGLQKEGDNLYIATQNSGDFDGIGIDITADGGYMTTGELEMSNVDLSGELTGMIVTQRGFQANSRIITVSDTMLEELINLKR